METEILIVTSHIKNVRKKGVTNERINSELRRKNMLIGEKVLKRQLIIWWRAIN